MEEERISHRAEPMRVGSLVRWNAFPDRLYYITEMDFNFCGNPHAVCIESIDHIWVGIVNIENLTLDDVDYDEVTIKNDDTEPEKTKSKKFNFRVLLLSVIWSLAIILTLYSACENNYWFAVLAVFGLLVWLFYTRFKNTKIEI